MSRRFARESVDQAGRPFDRSSESMPGVAEIFGPLSMPAHGATYSLVHPDRPTTPNDPAVLYALTDARHAELFAEWCGEQLRFDHRRKRWLHYEPPLWRLDVNGLVYRLAIQFPKHRQSEALTIADRRAREAAVTFAIRAEGNQAIERVLALARHLLPLADAGDGWDADRWRLGAPNGIVDLRTGALRDGTPMDRISLSVAVNYSPAAACPTWLRFLESTFAGNESLISFLQKAAGYSLTGDTGEQVLFLAHGTGANGKGTFFNTLGYVLGGYHANLPFSALELHARASVPTDIAALVGRRFVTASETTDGTRLNEGRLKALTGCDPVTVRHLYGAWFTFEPVAKLWLAVNHKPVVRDSSHGFWRRVRLIPFTQTFPIDKTLGVRLKCEAPGILAWAVQGALRWQAEGLEPPDVVRDATADYQRESDVLAEFFEGACVLDADAEIGGADAYEHYRQWAARQGLSERDWMKATAFGRRMGERFEKRILHGRTVYRGVRKG